MIFTRIKRGATRTSLLVGYKLQTFKHAPKLVLPALRKLVPLSLVLPVVFLPLPVSAADVVLDDTDPSSQIPLTAAGAQLVSIALSDTTSTPGELSPFVTVGVDSLTAVEVGKSYQTVAKEQAEAAQRAAEAQRIAAEQAQKIEAARAAARVQFVRSGPGDYDALFQKYFGSEWQTAKAVCMAESGLNPTALSRTSDYGLCQINQVHRRRVGGDLTRLFDPETNIRVASDIRRDNGGWHPWTVYRTGKYLQYLSH